MLNNTIRCGLLALGLCLGALPAWGQGTTYIIANTPTDPGGTLGGAGGDGGLGGG